MTEETYAVELAGDWIEWTGGICPVENDTIIEYRLRSMVDNDKVFRCMAGMSRWDHGRTPRAALDHSLRRNDIVSYRIVALSDQRREG